MSPNAEKLLKVLIVDDDQIDRVAISRALQEGAAAVNVMEAPTGNAALALISTTPFDCIFLDYRLPDLDGLAVVKRVRGAGNQTPIVIFTAKGDERLAVEMLRAGATDYFPKSSLSGEAIATCLRNSIRIAGSELAKARVERDNQLYVTQLETLNKELDGFVYTVSHDLRAPLRAISNLSTWIEEDIASTASPDTRKNLSLLRGRVKRLELMLEGLLDYSRIGKSSVHASDPEVIDLNAMMIAILKTLPAAPNINISVPENLPKLRFERKRLEQVFSHLLANAVQFHTKNPGRVWIEFKEIADFLEFSVCDNGAGIASQDQERVFKVFETLVAKDQREACGLGLAIVKKVIEAAGGQISVDSTLGDGARFRFTLPKGLIAN